MGLLGCTLVLGRTYKHHIPRVAYRNLLTSVMYTPVAGLLGFQAIDNVAHVGGLMTGTLLGMLVTRRPDRAPQHVSPWVFYAGIIANGIIVLSTVIALVMIVFEERTLHLVLTTVAQSALSNDAKAHGICSRVRRCDQGNRGLARARVFERALTIDAARDVI